MDSANKGGYKIDTLNARTREWQGFHKLTSKGVSCWMWYSWSCPQWTCREWLSSPSLWNVFADAWFRWWEFPEDIRQLSIRRRKIETRNIRQWDVARAYRWSNRSLRQSHRHCTAVCHFVSPWYVLLNHAAEEEIPHAGQCCRGGLLCLASFRARGTRSPLRHDGEDVSDQPEALQWSDFIVRIVKKTTHESDAKDHEIFDLIFSYSTGVVDHRVGPLDEYIVGTSHVARIKGSGIASLSRAENLHSLHVKYILGVARWYFWV